LSENPFYTLPLYSKYYPYCIIAYMKEEMVDTTYGDVFIKVSISFIRIPSLFSYDNLSIFDKILHINNTISNNILIALQK